MLYNSLENKYEVIKNLGGGEHSTTYLVKKITDSPNKNNNTYYVLKELKIANAERWTIIERFKKEIEILKMIEHERIPKFIDIIETENTIAYVQEYIDGKTFKELIENNENITNEDFKDYFIQALDILNYLHTMIPPVIHQDISPKNIILKDKKIYLIDFGSVKTAIMGEKTQTLTTVGTFGYMSPEQIMGKAVVSSDLYSLGMTFLALKNRIKAKNFKIDNKTGNIDKEFITSSLPSEFKEIFLKLTESSNKKRFQTTQKVISEIKIRENTEKNKKPFYLKKTFIILSIIFTVSAPDLYNIYKLSFKNHKNINYIKISSNQKYVVMVTSDAIILKNYNNNKSVYKIKGSFDKKNIKTEFSDNNKYLNILIKYKTPRIAYNIKKPDNRYIKIDIENKKIEKEINLTEILIGINETIDMEKVRFYCFIYNNKTIYTLSNKLYLLDIALKKSILLNNDIYVTNVEFLKRFNIFFINSYHKTYYFDVKNNKLMVYNNIKNTLAVSQKDNFIVAIVNKHKHEYAIYKILNKNSKPFLKRVCKNLSLKNSKFRFSNDGNFLVSWPYGYDNGYVKFYNVNKCSLNKKIKKSDYGNINNIEIINNNQEIAILKNNIIKKIKIK